MPFRRATTRMLLIAGHGWSGCVNRPPLFPVGLLNGMSRCLRAGSRIFSRRVLPHLPSGKSKVRDNWTATLNTLKSPLVSWILSRLSTTRAMSVFWHPPEWTFHCLRTLKLIRPILKPFELPGWSSRCRSQMASGKLKLQINALFT
ncbi:hypothetical protein D3C81_1389600 [compost metagenome]